MHKATKGLLLLLVLSLLLSGCAAPPDQTVTKFLDAMKAQNAEEMVTYVIQEGNVKMDTEFEPQDPQQIQFIKAVLGKLSYKVEKATITGDTATVPANITCIDMITVAAGVMSKVANLAAATESGGELSDEQLDAMAIQMLVNAIADPNAPMTTQDIVVPMRKTAGKWLIVLNEQTADTFINASTGNFRKVFSQ